MVQTHNRKRIFLEKKTIPAILKTVSSEKQKNEALTKHFNMFEKEYIQFYL